MPAFIFGLAVGLFVAAFVFWLGWRRQREVRSKEILRANEIRQLNSLIADLQEQVAWFERRPRGETP